ncbi:MAG: glycosyltransferase family 2 protein [Spirochaetaceae bacterium]|jgi:glycosyltransferase involved in cell wall biosynthesis|nr:glycosyltransferase family 2 protein [Spirochaetaceae bacterium]
MKKISIIIPCYNEEENIISITNAVVSVLENRLSGYDYEIIISDNCSKDNTRVLIREICEKNRKIKAIFNMRNFGPDNSRNNAYFSAAGDCSIIVFANFQNPPELIPAFVREWEAGYKFVAAVKIDSKENKIILLIRRLYHKIIRMVSDIEQIENYTGYALFDKQIIDIMRSLNDPLLHTHSVPADLGFKRKEIPYIQPARRSGKSKYNFYRHYETAARAFTSYTNTGLRIATITGFICAAISFFIAVGYFIYKLFNRDAPGTAPVIGGIFILSSLQLFLMGFIGEYIMAINTRLINRPVVVEEERINFDEAK